jgi:dTMP kinase
MTSSRGLFITVEGGEGVGKSTNIDVIKSYLDSHKIPYILTREPGGTLIAEKIRELLLDSQEEDFDPTCELLLVFAARAQHLNQLIRPTLESGTWVLCDRFTDATYAYQGAGRQLDKNLIASLEQLVQKDLRPDLTVILDLDPEIGLQRARERGELDRIEQEAMEFFRSVRECYLQIASNDPQRCVIVDASASVEEVSQQLRALLEARLGAMVQSR